MTRIKERGVCIFFYHHALIALEINHMLYKIGNSKTRCVKILTTSEPLKLLVSTVARIRQTGQLPGICIIPTGLALLIQSDLGPQRDGHN